jgi:hypothetical protein
MVRIIRLTERDLTKIVRRVIKENDAPERYNIYEAPTATPPPKPGVTANSTTMVQATFNCRYNNVNAVGTVKGSITKLPTGAFKPSDYISVMVGNKLIARFALNTSDLVYYFDKNSSSAEGVEGMNMYILKGKKPQTVISEVVAQISKGTGSNLRLSNNVINAFNKIPSGVMLSAKTPMPKALKPFISTMPDVSLYRTLDPETNAIVKTELWLGISQYSYTKNANGDLRTTLRGSTNLLAPFSGNAAMKSAVEDYDMDNKKMRTILDGLWATLEPNLA